jgi:periplasmic protein TonB
MRTAALKKFETADPAHYSAPDPAAPGGSPRPLQAHVPFSSFALSEGRNTTRLKQRIVAYGAAAILECSLLAAIWIVLEGHPTPQPDDNAAAIEMVQAPQEPVPKPQVPQKIELPTLKPMQVRSMPRLRLAIDRPLPIPSPQMALQSPPPAAPPSTPSPPASTEAVDRFDAEVRAAIQAAIVYPPAARMMKQQGRTKVAFQLIRGRAEDPRVVQSSGILAIDTAAVAAVRDAAYPTPPAELAGKTLEFAVFVEFSLSR